jgi:hypothetical protein
MQAVMSGLTAEQRAALANGCKTGLDAVSQIETSLGC